MTVEEILAAEMYTDRRGRTWHYLDTIVDYDRWQRWEHYSAEDLILEVSEMRLLIERDKHECDSLGLTSCGDHPTVSVLQNRDTGFWLVFERYGVECVGREYHEWSDAMNAAYRLAVAND